jgi:hypothetical protein
MKNLILTAILIIPLIVSAQGVFTNNASTTLQKVLGDYPNNFKNITGKLLSQEPQSTDYVSTVQIPGSVNAVVTRYGSTPDKPVYSWRCVMAESEEFDVVAKKYKDLYNQVRNSIITIGGEKPFILNGNYQEPTEEKKFISSELFLLPATGTVKKLKVELTLEYMITEWKMSVLVYDQQDAAVALESGRF